MRAETGLPRARALVAVPRERQIGHGLDPTGTILSIAADRVRLIDVIGYEVDGLAEKDFSSTFATAALFGSFAIAFMIFVYVFAWRDRFLLGAFLLGAIAFFAVIDLKRVTWLTTYTFTLQLASGAVHSFSTTSEPEALRLKAALDFRLGRAAPA